jgi:hypothetical protein
LALEVLSTDLVAHAAEDFGHAMGGDACDISDSSADAGTDLINHY